MSDRVLVPSVVVAGDVAGWLAAICLRGSAAVLEEARRDALEVPLDDIRAAIQDLEAVSRAFRSYAGANDGDTPTRRAIADASAAFNGAERPPLWSACDVANHFGISEARVRQLADSGELAARKVGTTWVFFEMEVREWRQ
jgi:hypothetical protein